MFAQRPTRLAVGHRRPAGQHLAARQELSLRRHDVAEAGHQVISHELLCPLLTHGGDDVAIALIGQVFLGPAVQTLQPYSAIVERTPIEQHSAVIEPRGERIELEHGGEPRRYGDPRAL